MQRRLTLRGRKQGSFFDLSMRDKQRVLNALLHHERSFVRWSQKNMVDEWGDVLMTYQDFIRDSPFRYSIHPYE